MDNLLIIIAVGIYVLIAIILYKNMVIDKRLSNMMNIIELDPQEKIIADKIAKLRYEDEVKELEKKKAERKKEEERISLLDEEARRLGL